MDVKDAQAGEDDQQPITGHEKDRQLDEDKRLQDEVDVEVGYQQGQEQTKKESTEETVREDPQKSHV
jgi:hypothetical protein